MENGEWEIHYFISETFCAKIREEKIGCACMVQPLSELIWVPCNAISYSCSQSVTERPSDVPNFGFYIFTYSLIFFSILS